MQVVGGINRGLVILINPHWRDANVFSRTNTVILKTLNNINHNLRELPFTCLWLSCLECHVFAYSPHVLIGGDVTLWKHANSLITVFSALNAAAAVLCCCVGAALLMIDCCRLLTRGRCPLVKNGSFCLLSRLRYSIYIFCTLSLDGELLLVEAQNKNNTLCTCVFQCDCCWDGVGWRLTGLSHVDIFRSELKR